MLNRAVLLQQTRTLRIEAPQEPRVGPHLRLQDHHRPIGPLLPGPEQTIEPVFALLENGRTEAVGGIRRKVVLELQDPIRRELKHPIKELVARAHSCRSAARMHLSIPATTGGAQRSTGKLTGKLKTPNQWVSPLMRDQQVATGISTFQFATGKLTGKAGQPPLVIPSDLSEKRLIRNQ